MVIVFYRQVYKPRNLGRSGIANRQGRGGADLAAENLRGDGTAPAGHSPSQGVMGPSAKLSPVDPIRVGETQE